ncbi:MAG TPA: hypothetical protein VF230_06965 [Acidimicrobiales bacterium]
MIGVVAATVFAVSLAGCSAGEDDVVDTGGTSTPTSTTEAGGASPETKPVTPLGTTDTCPEADVRELERVLAYVEGRSWTTRDTIGYAVLPDTTRCRVVIRTDELNADEEAALRREGGAFVEIERVPAPERR